MDINHLREFVELGKTLNFTTAARNLHLVQSTLSKHISQLESDTGLTLFNRTTNSTRLTPEGLAFLEGTIATLASHDQALKSARTLKGQHVGIIRVGGDLRITSVQNRVNGASAFMAKQQAPFRIEQYAPHTTGNLPELAKHDPEEALRDHLIDVAIFATSMKLDNCKQYTLYREPLVVITSVDHPLVARSSKVLADFKKDTFLFPVAFKHLHQGFFDACERSKFKPNTTTRVCNTFGEFLADIRKHEVICIPQSLADRVPPSDISGLTKIVLDAPCPFIEVIVAYNDDLTNPGLPVFLDALDAVNGLNSLN